MKKIKNIVVLSGRKTGQKLPEPLATVVESWEKAGYVMRYLQASADFINADELAQKLCQDEEYAAPIVVCVAAEYGKNAKYLFDKRAKKFDKYWNVELDSRGGLFYELPLSYQLLVTYQIIFGDLPTQPAMVLFPWPKDDGAVYAHYSAATAIWFSDSSELANPIGFLEQLADSHYEVAQSLDDYESRENDGYYDDDPDNDDEIFVQSHI